MFKSSSINTTLLAAAGVTFVLACMIGGNFIQETQACESDEPATCNALVGNPAEKVLEESDGEFLAKLRSVEASELKDFRPEFAREYEACSMRTGTALMHRGTPVTNQWCAALGCNYKQCVRKTYECDQETGLAKESDPMITCVAAAMQSEMQPARFVAFFFSLLASILLCVLSCVAGESKQNDTPVTSANVGVIPQASPTFLK
jgi:hypothetical protein